VTLHSCACLVNFQSKEYIHLFPIIPTFQNHRKPKGIPEEDFYLDRPIGLYNYTNFDSSNHTLSGDIGVLQQQHSAQINMGNQQMAPLSQQGKMKSPLKTHQQVEKSAPADTGETVSHTLRANNIVCFQGKEHFLSTLYSVRFYHL
jgi:hypothetical protein